MSDGRTKASTSQNEGPIAVFSPSPLSTPHPLPPLHRLSHLTLLQPPHLSSQPLHDGIPEMYWDVRIAFICISNTACMAAPRAMKSSSLLPLM